MYCLILVKLRPGSFFNKIILYCIVSLNLINLTLTLIPVCRRVPIGSNYGTAAVFLDTVYLILYV